MSFKLKRRSRAAIVALVVALICSGVYLYDILSNDNIGASTIANCFVVFIATWAGVYTLRDISFGRRRSEIVPSIHYGWSFGRTITLGVLWLIGLTTIGFVATVFLVISTLSVFSENSLDSLLFGLPAFIPCMSLALFSNIYLVGRWTGEKSRDKGIIALLLATVLYFLVLFILNTSSVGFKAYMEMMSDANLVLSDVIFGVLFFWGIGLIGYWRGRRLRVSKYLSYLMQSLPIDTREAFVDLAYSETVALKGKSKDQE